jgi:hypothetical protein
MATTSKKVSAKSASSRQRVVGTSTNLDLQEALRDATDQLRPGPHTDIVECTIEKLEVSRGGIADVRTLSVTLVSK